MAQFSVLSEQYHEKKKWLDYRSAMICATIANSVRDPKKGKAAQPKDFMPKEPAKKTKVELSPEAMKHRLELITTAFGGEVKE